MEKEKLDNQTIETTFQEIKKITGVSNIKQVVDKVANKDKNYNHSVAKANEREIQINLIKDKIKRLDQEFIDLKNTASINTGDGTKTAKSANYDKEEESLLTKEQKLREELEELREKNTNTDLIYEKVIENLKSLTNYKKEENLDDSNMNRSFRIEDDLVSEYKELLIKTNNIANDTYNNMTKDEFVRIMKNKANEIAELRDDKDNITRSEKKKNTRLTISPKKHIKQVAAEAEVEEDEEDQKINEEFKGVVRSVFLFL